MADDPYLPAIVSINRTFRSTIRNGRPEHVQFYFEGMEVSRIPNERYETEYVEMLRSKYAAEGIDMILAGAAPVLRFLCEHNEVLFAGVPVVFLAQDQSRIADLDLGSNVTGIFHPSEPRQTLDLALSLQPKTKRVVVIAGNAPVDRTKLTQVRKDFVPYETTLEIDYLTDRTLKDLQQVVADLRGDTIVFYVSLLLDSDGNSYTGLESAAALSKVSSVPVYGTSQLQMGEGVIGGQLVDHESLGVLAGEAGLRILAGESPAAIKFKRAESVPMFDWQRLRHWNISEEALPPGSIVRFKEPTFWEAYKWQTIGTITFIVLETSLIGWLLLIRSRRRHAENESKRFAALAKDERQRLEEVVSNVPGIVWESRVVDEAGNRRAQFVSGYVKEMLGYSVEECLADPEFISSRVVEEDREVFKSQTNLAFLNDDHRIVQFRCVTKDGGWRWAESHIVPIRDESGNRIGLSGVTMDVTERKKAEDQLQERELELREAQRVGQIGSWEWNPENDTVTWTEELYRIAGIDPTLPAPNFAAHKKLYTAESSELLASAVEVALDTGMPYEVELEMIRRDNHRVWISAKGEVFQNDDSKPKLRGTLQDISGRKRAEQALQVALAEVKALQEKLSEENIYLKEMIKLEHDFEEIIGHSEPLKYVLFKIEQVAPTDTTVLITGETGTGKELVARAIHSNSLRKNRPLVKVNCAALSASLIESELFGHERGSFTGATARKIGRFELADGATIFLDEIGELPLDLQSKLLRVVQEGEFERLGSAVTKKVDVRIIAATNRKLNMEVARGAFREDLLFRLNVFPITVPPLRERRDDIPQLVEHFADRFSKKLGKKVRSVAPATMRRLTGYPWPGNIRELANVIERSIISSQHDILLLSDLVESTVDSQDTRIPKSNLEAVERGHIVTVLEATGWRIEGAKGAARILGLNPSTLRSRMLKLDIPRKRPDTMDTTT